MHPLLRDRRRDRVLEPHPRAAAGRRADRRPTGCWAAPSSCAARCRTAIARGRELGFPTANLVPEEALVCPGHGVYACLARGRLAPGGRQHRRAADLQHRPRRADRGLHARLRRRPLRQRAAPGLPRAPARRAPLRRRATRWSSRCAATSSARARSRRAGALGRAGAPAGAVRAPGSATVPPMPAITSERKREITAQFGSGEQRHRQHQGPDRAADRAHQPPHRAPARARQRPPLPPRAADARRQTPSLPGLPAAHDLEGYRALIKELGLRK